MRSWKPVGYFNQARGRLSDGSSQGRPFNGRIDTPPARKCLVTSRRAGSRRPLFDRSYSASMNQHGSQTVQAAQQDVRDTNGERWDTQSPSLLSASWFPMACGRVMKPAWTLGPRLPWRKVSPYDTLGNRFWKLEPPSVQGASTLISKACGLTDAANSSPFSPNAEGLSG